MCFRRRGFILGARLRGISGLPLEIMGFSKAEQEERVEQVLELVELSGFGKKFPWQLSGGMQQRASIARALAFDADILLMDEPFGALDEIVRDRLNEEVLKLWARTGKTIGFVTHSIPEAVYLSHQDRGDEPASGADYRCDRQPFAEGTPLGYSRLRRVHRDCAPGARGLAGGALPMSKVCVWSASGKGMACVMTQAKGAAR